MPRSNKKVVAFCNDTNDYPFGTHTWYFVDGNCRDLGNIGRKLSLTTCKETEFNCRNGDCISAEKRCDQRPHCKDKSDEDSCHIVKVPKTYVKDNPPLPASGGLLILSNHKFEFY